MKKTVMIMVMLAAMSMSNAGCSQEALSAIAGASGLTAAARILDDIEGTTDREKALLLADRLALEEERTAATTEADKVRIDNEIEKNEALTEAVAVANEASKIAGQAIETDWTDPMESGPFAATGIMAIIAYLTSKKKQKLSNVLHDFCAEADADTGKALRKKVNGN